MIDGVQRHTTLSESIDDYGCDSYSPLWFMVTQQLKVSWERLYGADPKVARRANLR
jgi:hypothetical protein